jgi:squalene-associated FAD-dependent desaturase
VNATLPKPRIAVIGAGWAGLAAAVRSVQRGADVTLIEMAREPGGRARRTTTSAGVFDNGQHILIGAYTATLALMRSVGADPDRLLLRQPLALVDPAGRGLRLPPGEPVPAFLRGVLGARQWRWRDRLALVAAAGGWWLRGFRCDPAWSVQQLCSHLPRAVQQALIEPLCVAALNTPMQQASASVFLRVLRDALFSGPGSADLLLPRAPLSALLPDPAWAWLQSAGARCVAGRRVQALARQRDGWQVDGETFDAVVLACSPTESARLAQAIAPAWAAGAASLRFEPIVTAWLRDDRLQSPDAMVALPPGPDAPAQFAFDLGALHSDPASRGLWAFVASSAAPWLTDGLAPCGRAMLAQARQAFPGAFAGPDARVLVHMAAERRATFACTPGLVRPAGAINPGLWAAGDAMAGPYPATLEGAVRNGLAAAEALCRPP